MTSPPCNRSRGLRRLLALQVAACAVLSGAQVALGTPATARGWPVPAPAGSVLEGPGGGPVVLSGRLGNDQIALVAFRGTGARRWVAASSPNCGNCEGAGEVRLNADGTYGPIGFTADRFWAVSQAGALVEGCPGVPLADGTCVAPASNAASVRASRAGATLWEYVEPGFTWSSEFDVEPRIVRDAAGVLYVQFGPGRDGSGWPREPGVEHAPPRLLALNPDGSLRFRAVGGGEPLAALADGVLVRTATGIAAVDSDGRERWSRTMRLPARMTADMARVDPERGRVYVQQGGAVQALAAETGSPLWTARGRMASLGRSGRLYVVDGRGVTALGADGRAGFRFRAALPVAGAAEQSDGRVAVSTAEIPYRGDTVGGLLTLLDPTRSAPTVTRSRVGLDRSIVNPRCPAGPDAQFTDYPTAKDCDIDGSRGATLRMELRRASRVRIAFREPDGQATPGLVNGRVELSAPAGVSHARLLLGERRLRAGRHMVVVTFREDGRDVVTRIPIRTT